MGCLHIALPNGRICGANRPGCASCRPRCGAIAVDSGSFRLKPDFIFETKSPNRHNKTDPPVKKVEIVLFRR